MNLKVAFSMILLLMVVFFTLQNTEIVSMRFFLWEFALSRALMFFLILGVGILTGFVLGTHTKKRGIQKDKDVKHDQV